MKIMSDLIACLYKIAEAIREKKQETESEENQSTQSIIVEPVAMFQYYDKSNVLKSFDKSFIDYSPTLALYKIEDFQQTNDNSLSVEDAVVEDVEVNNNLSLKDNKIYFLQTSSRRLYSPNTESAVYAQFLDTNQNGLYLSYEPRPFVQNGQAFDFIKSQDYTIDLESFVIDGLEIEDLNNLYFIVGVNVT